MINTQVGAAAKRYEHVWHALRSEIDQIRYKQQEDDDERSQKQKNVTKVAGVKKVPGDVFSMSSSPSRMVKSNSRGDNDFGGSSSKKQMEESGGRRVRGGDRVSARVSDKDLIKRIERLGKQMSVDRKATTEQQRFIAELVQHVLENQSQNSSVSGGDNHAARRDFKPFSGMEMADSAKNAMPHLQPASGVATTAVDLTNDARREWVRTSILQIGASMKTFEALQVHF